MNSMNKKRVLTIFVSLVMIATTFVVAVQSDVWNANDRDYDMALKTPNETTINDDAERPNEPRIETGDFDGYKYKCNYNYDVYFHENIINEETVKFVTNSDDVDAFLSWEMPTTLKWVYENEKEEIIGVLRSSEAKIDANCAVYEEIYTNSYVTLEYTIEESLLKENIIIGEKIEDLRLTSVNEDKIYLSIDMELNYPDELIMRIDGIEQGSSYTTDKNINFYRDDRLVYTIIKPYAVDAKGDIGMSHYDYDIKSDSRILRLKTPYTWLKEAEYPVTIDPILLPPEDEPLKGERRIITNDEILALKDDFFSVGNDFWGRDYNSSADTWEKLGGDILDMSVVTTPVKTAFIGDFDGDGKDEVAGLKDSTGTTGNEFWIRGYNRSIDRWEKIGGDYLDMSIWSTPAKTAFIGDFNGDGKDEIAALKDSSGSKGNDFWIRSYNKTTGWWEKLGGNYLNMSTDNIPAKTAFIGDFDGDGKDEIAALKLSLGSAGNDFWVRGYNRTTDKWEKLGGDFLDMSNLNIAVKDAFIGDFNGDGKDEIAALKDTFGTAGNEFWVRSYNQSTDKWEKFGGDYLDMSKINTPAKTAFIGDFDGDYRDEIAAVKDASFSAGNDFWIRDYDKDTDTWEKLGGDELDMSTDLISAKATYIGDFDGDGRDEIAALKDFFTTIGNDFWVRGYDPINNKWNKLGGDFLDMAIGHIPVKKAFIGDFDGNGRDEIAALKDSTGSTGNDFWIRGYDPLTDKWEKLGGNYLDLSGFSSAKNAFIGDFDGDNIILGDPIGKPSSDYLFDVMVELNSPPYHEGINNQFASEARWTETISQGVTTGFTSITSWSVSVGAGFDIEILNAEMEVSYGEEFKKSKEYTKSTTFSAGWKARGEDKYLILGRIWHTWEYPIISTPEDDFLLITVPGPLEIQMDISADEIPTYVPEGYTPNNGHIIGDITSYLRPVDDDHNPLLDRIVIWTISQSGNGPLVLSESTSETITKERTKSKSIGAEGGGFGVKLEGKYGKKTVSTYSIKHESTSTIEVEYGADPSFVGKEAYKYKVRPVFYYRNVDNVLVVDYQVLEMGFGYYQVDSVEVIDQGTNTSLKPNVVEFDKSSNPQGHAKMQVNISDPTPTGEGITNISKMFAYVYEEPEILGYIVDPTHLHDVVYVVYQEKPNPEIKKTVQLFDEDKDGQWESEVFDSTSFSLNRNHIIDLELIDENDNTNLRENQGSFIVIDPIVVGVGLATDIDFAVNIKKAFDMIAETDTLLEVTSTEEVFDACISVVEYGENIKQDFGTTDLRRKTGLDKFVQIAASRNIEDSKFSTTIKIYYDDTDNDGVVDGTKVNEDTLKLYWWNGDYWVEAPGGVDTTNNHVSGTVNHFGYFAPFGNSIPAATPGFNQTVKEGDTVYFDGSSSYDNDGVVISYEWDFGDPYEDALNPNKAICADPTHIYYRSGIYTVTLTVTDNFDEQDTNTMFVTVLNVDPIADAGPNQTVNEGDIAHFDGSSSYRSAGTILRYEWDFGDSNANALNPNIAIGPNPTHIFYDDGIYTVTLTVKDNYGEVGTSTITITVLNVAPTADAGPDQPCNVGHVVTFTGDASDPANSDPMMDPLTPHDPLTYYWDFNASDGIQVEAVGPIVQHIYLREGIYIVTLTVNDGDGGISTDTCVVYTERKLTILDEPIGEIVYSDSEIIHVTLLDENAETLMDQAATPKTVYLEYRNGNTWVIIAQDILTSVDDSDYELDLHFELPQMPNFDPVAGVYNSDIRVRYDGDYRYNGTMSYGTLTIVKEDTVISDPSVSIVYSDTATVTVSMLDNDGEQILHQTDEPKILYLEYTLIGGEGTWTLLDTQILSNGQAIFQFSLPQTDFDLTSGEYYIRVRYNGDARYNPAVIQGVLLILKEDTILSDPSLDIIYSDWASVTVTIMDNDINQLFHQDDKTIYLEVFDGYDWVELAQEVLDPSPTGPFGMGDGQVTFYFTVPQGDFDPMCEIDWIYGQYPLRVQFYGDNKYNPTITNGILTVYKETVVLTDPTTNVDWTNEMHVQLTMLDNDQETLLHTEDQPKIVYLELDYGYGWGIIAQDELEFDGDYTLDFLFSLPQSHIYFNPTTGTYDYTLMARYLDDNRYLTASTQWTLQTKDVTPAWLKHHYHADDHIVQFGDVRDDFDGGIAPEAIVRLDGIVVDIGKNYEINDNALITISTRDASGREEVQLAYIANINSASGKGQLKVDLKQKASTPHYFEDDTFFDLNLKSGKFDLELNNDLDDDGLVNEIDPDIDGDGTYNWNDPDDDNDGVPDTQDLDDDNDGIVDWKDFDINNDLDNDGIPNRWDDDDDGDGLLDSIDIDDDNDGVPDDHDIDDDGLMNWEDPDVDGDGIQNAADPDDDNDGVSDTVDGYEIEYPDMDDDNDGTFDYEDTDYNDDLDGDGIENWRDTDTDGDGTIDAQDNDDDNDGNPDTMDWDDDNDGTLDSEEVDFDNDWDNDGTHNEADDDDDGDGILDFDDTDDDNDGIPDNMDLDDDNDGILDWDE